MTEPEQVLWGMLRRMQHGLRFRRQHPLGPYILDFYCPSARLAVEVDGPSHDRREQQEHDARRTLWLISEGVRVVRVSADDVKHQPAAVVAKIVAAAAPSTA